MALTNTGPAQWHYIHKEYKL